MGDVIMAHSDEAAEFKSVEGWVSRDGYFYGENESAARYSGATHRKCECEKVIEISSLVCLECRKEKALKRYYELPEAPFEGVPLYSNMNNEYYWCEDAARDAAHFEKVSLDAMMFESCVPTYLEQFDFDDILVDDLPEDQSLSDVAPEILMEKIHELNKTIQSEKIVLSWRPSGERVSLPSKATD